MIDILLITDIPRVRKIFSRIADAQTVKVRVANNLEKGGEELLAEKPTIVFVQTHLSGLSAEIILMHLKKQLGRKRTRFVLLAPKELAAPYIIKSYHGHIDISETDDRIQADVRQLMTALLAKPGKKPLLSIMTDLSVIPPHEVEEHISAVLENEVPEQTVVTMPLAFPEFTHQTVQDTAPQPVPETLPEPTAQEPSAAEQGIAYPSRQRLSVYSEFNSSFDSAVNTMEPAEKVADTLRQEEHTWHTIETAEQREPASENTKRNFLLWLAPVVIVVIVVTYLQQKRTPPEKPKTAALAIKEDASRTLPPVPKPETQTAAPITIPVPAQSPLPVTPAVTTPPPEKKQIPEAVVSPVKPSASAKTTRLKQLPDFVPRYGYDKNYGKENPGWERYKGQVTEFKILRDGEGIKAIQVVDRGGDGVPESFMKGVLRQLTAKPSLEITSKEKKEDYEIQRGRISDSQDIVYYRDADGGRLRGFVVTWR